MHETRMQGYTVFSYRPESPSEARGPDFAASLVQTIAIASFPFLTGPRRSQAFVFDDADAKERKRAVSLLCRRIEGGWEENLPAFFRIWLDAPRRNNE
jgi:hypothetical protein